MVAVIIWGIVAVSVIAVEVGLLSLSFHSCCKHRIRCPQGVCSRGVWYFSGLGRRIRRARKRLRLAAAERWVELAEKRVNEAELPEAVARWSRER